MGLGEKVRVRGISPDDFVVGLEDNSHNKQFYSSNYVENRIYDTERFMK